MLYKKVFSIGVFWGILETLIVLEAFLQRAFYSGALMLFLLFCLSLLIGYKLVEVRVTVLALFLSQAVAFLMTLGVVLFLGLALVKGSGSASTAVAGSVLLLFFILGTVGAIGGSLPGAIIGDILESPVTKARLVLSDYQIGLRAIILLALAGSVTIIGYSTIIQLQDSLSQTNNDLAGLQSISRLEQHLSLTTKTALWGNGTSTIPVDYQGAIDPGNPIYHFPGYLRISWTSTGPLTFRITVLDATSSTNSSAEGDFRVSVVGFWTNPPASFHNDSCTFQGCPSGNVTYSTEWWW